MKRLEEIKEILNYPNYTEHNGQEVAFFMIDENDLNWLIEQAKKTLNLRDELESIADCISEYYENDEDDIPVEDILDSIKSGVVKTLKKNKLD